MKLLRNYDKTAVTDVSKVHDVVVHDTRPLEVKTDPASYAKLGWWIVLAGVGGFFLWAFFAPLDKGVPVSGTVTVTGNRKSIQHPTGGRVDEILVKEGDVVKAGQVLVKMNDVTVKAAAMMTRGQLYNDLAIGARLQAERDNKSTIAVPAALTAAEKTDPSVVNDISLQRQLFNARVAALHNELAGSDQSVAGLKLQLAGLTDSMKNKQDQLVLIKEQLVGMRDLAKDGYIARNRLLDVERTYSQMNGAVSEDLGNIGRSKSQILEQALRRAQRLDEYQKEVRTQLSEIEKETDALQNRLVSQDYDLANSTLTAPVSGTVVGLAIFTQGGVVQPGFRMMDIVPNDEPLIVEGQIPVNLIDKVHVGLKLEMIFSAFNQNQTPHIPGVITEVSADRLTDERTGAPFYKFHAQVSPKGLPMIKNLAIRPGMPVELFVKTGERSMISYLLKPILDRAKTSMTEE